VTRMNAEHIEYQDDFFDSALMFLLLHEMPPAARRRSLREALRVIRPGGRFVVAEYGEFGRRHVLHRFLPMRWVLTTVEPFLGGFWQVNLDQLLRDSAAAAGKQIELEEQVSIFGGFYRVLSYRLQ
jgi:ubiquinone/menaquinone biosynthesis C-methylase UbiE